MLSKLKNLFVLPSLAEEGDFFGVGAAGNAAFQNYCKQHKIYEFLTKEYIEALGNELSLSAKEYSKVSGVPIKILEVCAGDGRLSHFLQEFLEQKNPGLCSLIATDSGEWGIKPIFPVAKLDHQQALSQIRPDIVICSWMPKGKDLTADFRASKSVKEYILIGNPTECGDPWLTWGEKTHKVSPFEQQKFHLEMFGKEFPKQLCMDSDLNGKKQHSWTYRFHI